MQGGVLLEFTHFLAFTDQVLSQAAEFNSERCGSRYRSAGQKRFAPSDRLSPCNKETWPSPSVFLYTTGCNNQTKGEEPYFLSCSRVLNAIMLSFPMSVPLVGLFCTWHYTTPSKWNRFFAYFTSENASRPIESGMSPVSWVKNWGYSSECAVRASSSPPQR